MHKTIETITTRNNTHSENLIAELRIISQKIEQDAMGPLARESVNRTGNPHARWLASFEILKSLPFPTIHQRYEALTKAHAKTFEWIFREEAGGLWQSYTKWLGTGQGIYWIQGKAASGKSTLMRFISEDNRTVKYLSEWSGDLPLEVSRFYFWKSGVLEQRSLVGLLRSLLYETLSMDAYKDLIPKVFAAEWKRAFEVANFDGDSQLSASKEALVEAVKLETNPWRLSSLKEAFARFLKETASRLRICFFIDGLDEYDGDHEEIAVFFNEISSQYDHVKFCISSRPWLVFDDIFEHSPGLKLQDLTYDDIKLYVQEKLGKNKKMIQLHEEDPVSATCFVEEIVHKACGTFLWVTLVVKSLMAGLRNCDDIQHLRKRLEALPADLETVYGHMFDSIDSLYQEDAAVIFLLVKFAQDFPCEDLPFNIPALHRALTADFQSTMSLKIVPCKETMPQRAISLKSYERLRVTLKECCQGLLEVLPLRELPRGSISSDEDFPPISYLHLTVKDFLEKPEILTKIKLNASKRMEPPISILMSGIMQLKQSHPRSSLVAKILRHFLLIAPQLSQGSARLHIPLLDECDRVMKNHWPDPSGHWSICCHSYKDYRGYKSFHDFISLAVHSNLQWYVDRKLADDPSLLGLRQGAPLLALALGWHIWNTRHDDPSPNLEVLEVLLRHGANPNQIFEQHPVWKLAVHHVYTTHNKWSPPIQRSMWWQAFNLMLLHGADPNVRCCNHQQCCAQYDCNTHDASGCRQVPRLTGCMSWSKDCWSLECVIIEVFSELGLDDTDELLQLLEEKRKANSEASIRSISGS
jgi:hypothetical protein